VIYTCCHAKRGEAVRLHPTLNGIEFLEVLDEDAPPLSPPQRTLLVRCYKPVGSLDESHVRIDGGTRVRPVDVLEAFPASDAAVQPILNADEVAFLLALDEPSHVLVVRTAVYGDFSVYTLRLRQGVGLDDPPPGFDTLLSSLEFSFKAECPTRFDCLQIRTCPPAPRPTPLISYLAKDYASFRRIMLDRMSLLAPAWRERNAADLMITLVEALAYVGDSLSYGQDAVATEAYLHTARRRVSARRHARLVDYFMHDGANARAWIHIRTQDTVLIVPAHTEFVTGSARLAAPVVTPEAPELATALAGGATVFESMHRAVCYPAHNQRFFYTWVDEACALPKGATRATLRDGGTPATRLRLRAGDVLVFEERLGPETGNAADADPTRRHPVRLTKVEPEASLVVDAAGLEIDRTPGPARTDPLTGQPIVLIEWGALDQLPFPLCISSPRTDTELADQVWEDVSAATGNILLADHGRTIDAEEPLGEVPVPTLFEVSPDEPVFCAADEARPILPRFRPRLAQGPLTQVGHVLVEGAGGTVHRAPFDPAAAAAAAFAWELRRALPAVEAVSDGGERWTPERDLLDSGKQDRHLVAEVDSDEVTRLRFGDGEHGRRPEAGSTFVARYRVGNGVRGNLGAEALIHVVDPKTPGFSPQAVLAVRNPLPARGGVEPETIEEVRQSAPVAFRTQERAVTLDDYAAAALRHPGLQGAAARFRWTGSWRTVFVTLDPLCRDTRDPVSGLKADVRAHLERFRMAGYDLVVDNPRYVSLEIELHVCVERDYLAADVEQALLEVFTSGFRPDGSTGLFHPDRFPFGQPVYLSPLIEAALAIEGVRDVRFTTFQRQGRPDQGKALEDGRIVLSRLEIARLENDPNFPEHGTFRVSLEGGR
jgi:hypothetical protein